MRCGNIRIHVEIPVYADKNNCFCDDNHVSYSIPAIREACETASNLPIIQYDEQGTEKVVGVAQCHYARRHRAKRYAGIAGKRGKRLT